MIPYFSPIALNAGALVASQGTASYTRLHRVIATNTNGSTRYIQVFDAAALPADTAVPLIAIPVATAAVVTLDLGIYGRPFAKGIWVCNSTTEATKTIGAADSFLDLLVS